MNSEHENISQFALLAVSYPKKQDAEFCSGERGNICEMQRAVYRI